MPKEALIKSPLSLSGGEGEGEGRVNTLICLTLSPALSLQGEGENSFLQLVQSFPNRMSERGLEASASPYALTHIPSPKGRGKCAVARMCAYLHTCRL